MIVKVIAKERMMFDVVTLGELLIDMVATARNVTLFDAPAFEPKAGGAPANVAVGVARLGRKAAFIGKVGYDSFGMGLRRTLDAEGVDTSNLLYDNDHMTTLAFVSLSEKGDPDFAFFAGAHTHLKPSDLDAELIGSAKAFHFGSVSLAHEPSRAATLEGLRIARDGGVICSYDVNWRPALWKDPDAGLQIVSEPLHSVDVLKMNGSELYLLTGENDPERGLTKIDTSARLVIVTLAERGCMYRYEGGIYAESVPPVDAIDGTGAGDSFVAALLSELNMSYDKATMARLVRRACKAGAITTTRRGAIPSLPTAAELGEW
jgi:fructokinase